MSVRSRSGGRPAVIGGSSDPGPAAGRGLAPRRAGRGGSGPGRRPRTGRGRPRSPRCSSRRRTAAAARAGGRRAGGRGRAAPRRPRRGSRPPASMSTGSATTRPGAERGLERGGRPAAPAPTLVGDHVARDPEQPHAERRGVRAVLGRGELAEPGQRGEGAHEHALRRVLRGVVVGELVEGVGIHLGEVLPVQGVELGRIPTGRLDERAVAIERDDASTRRSLPPSKHRTGHRVTPRPGRVCTRRTSPAWTIRSPSGAAASSTTSPPEAASTPSAGIGARVVVERHQPPRRRLALGPRREVEVARPQGGHPRVEAVREAREQRMAPHVGLHVTRIGAKRRRCAFPTRASRDERDQDRREGGDLDQPCADATATVRSGTRRHGYGRWDSRCSAGWDEATMAWRR